MFSACKIDQNIFLAKRNFCTGDEAIHVLEAGSVEGISYMKHVKDSSRLGFEILYATLYIYKPCVRYLPVLSITLDDKPKTI